MDDEFIVDEDGIYVKRMQWGDRIYEKVISKEAFIEAYNKYIKCEEEKK